MDDCCKLFNGMHNFISFCDINNEEISTKVLVDKIWLEEDEDKIYIRIKASHFLWKMVRRVVGTLVEVGRGNISKENIEKFLETYSDIPSKLTAPPSGLFLEKVIY
jgi:tRNA pseudouridine38-40 synthase